jgi:hypothetical protein
MYILLKEIRHGVAEYSWLRIRSSDWLSAHGNVSLVCIEGKELHEWLTDYDADFAPRSCLSLFMLHFVLLHTSFEISINQLKAFFFVSFHKKRV